MGHERVGRLPRSERWVTVVEGIETATEDPNAAAELANATLRNVRGRLERIENDSGVAAAVQYLIALSHSEAPEVDGLELPDLTETPSAARLALSLCRWVDSNLGEPEYAELAKQAGADTIAHWSDRERSQVDLFPERFDLEHRWREAATGGGFSEVAREFFARFTERYLRYFLDREASASVKTITARDQFDRNISRHVDAVARHAFETSKITQSFAAGWYNRYAAEELPSARQIRGFLRLAFQKIREELRRELEAE